MILFIIMCCQLFLVNVSCVSVRGDCAEGGSVARLWPLSVSAVQHLVVADAEETNGGIGRPADIEGHSVNLLEAARSR